MTNDHVQAPHNGNCRHSLRAAASLDSHRTDLASLSGRDTTRGASCRRRFAGSGDQERTISSTRSMCPSSTVYAEADNNAACLDAL